MSDTRLERGLKAAIVTGLAGAIAAPVVLVTPAQAADITKTQTWNDGQATYEFPQTIVEGGVTYQLVSQSNPTPNDTPPRTVTIPTKFVTREYTYGANEPRPQPNFESSITVNENGATATLQYSGLRDWSEKDVPNNTTEHVPGTSEYEVRQRIPDNATDIKVYQAEENLWYADFKVNRPKKLITYVGAYNGTTVVTQAGSRTWTRNAVYRSVDSNANNAQTAEQQRQLQEAQRQEEERRKQEQQRQEEERRKQEEANQQQAKTVDEAKAQSTQLITSTEGTLSGSDSSYVSDETKSQVQGALDQLKQAIDSNDLVNINTAYGTLKQASDRMTQEISDGKAKAGVSDGSKDGKDGKDGKDSSGSGDEDDDEGDDDDEKPEETPTDPEETKKKGIDIVPLAAGLLGLVAAGGIIGVIVAKKKKKKDKEQAAAVDPTMAAAAGAGVAGAAIMPAVSELDNLAVIPGYVPVADGVCQVFAYLSDEENKPVLESEVIFSPADDIPTLVELPTADESDPFVAAWVEEDGSWRLVTDENGEVVYQVDEEGNPVLDDEGNPMPEAVIPNYILVLPQDGLQSAVSKDLLVYSDDGQEIFRGELAEYTQLDTAVLWAVINEQFPEEERTNVIDEVSDYVSRLNDIDEANDVAIEQYEAQRQAQIEEQERIAAEQKAAEEAAAAAAAAQMAQGQGMAADGSYGYDASLAAPADGYGMADGAYAAPAGGYGMTDGYDPSQQGMVGDSLDVTSDGLGFDAQQQDYEPTGLPDYGYDQMQQEAAPYAAQPYDGGYGQDVTGPDGFVAQEQPAYGGYGQPEDLPYDAGAFEGGSDGFDGGGYDDDLDDPDDFGDEEAAEEDVPDQESIAMPAPAWAGQPEEAAGEADDLPEPFAMPMSGEADAQPAFDSPDDFFAEVGESDPGSTDDFGDFEDFEEFDETSTPAPRIKIPVRKSRRSSEASE